MDYNKLLKAFLYDKATRSPIVDYCNGVRNAGNESMWSVDDTLQLGPNHRRIVSVFKVSTNLELYNKFVELANRNMVSMAMDMQYGGNITDDKYNAANKLFTENINIEAFESGRTKDGSKLFKAFIKAGLLTQSEIGKINKLKQPTKPLQLVISRNIIDFIMASTGQQFQSCVSLDNINGYYFGLPGNLLDPNSVLLYATTGALHEYRLAKNDDSYNETIQYFKYAARSFALVNPVGEITPIANYPKDTTINFYELLKQKGFVVKTIYETVTTPRTFIDYKPATTGFTYKGKKYIAMTYYDAMRPYVTDSGLFSHNIRESQHNDTFYLEQQPFGTTFSALNRIDYKDSITVDDNGISPKEQKRFISFGMSMCQHLINNTPDIMPNNGGVYVNTVQIVLDAHSTVEIEHIVSGCCPLGHKYCVLVITDDSRYIPTRHRMVNAIRDKYDFICPHYQGIVDCTEEGCEIHCDLCKCISHPERNE